LKIKVLNIIDAQCNHEVYCEKGFTVVPKVCKPLSFRWKIVYEISEFLSRIDMVGLPRRRLVFGYCENFTFYTSVIHT